jgi:two-component system response regulator YesN
MALKKLILNRRKVLITWVASYLIILIIPILIGFFAYARSISIINDEVNKAHNLSLQQLKSVLDSRFGELSRLDSVLSLNQNIRRLINSNPTLSTKGILSVFEAQKDLGKFMISNSFVDKIYIYINNSELMFTDTYKYTGDEIDGLCKNTLGIDIDNFLEMAKTTQTQKCMITTTRLGKKNLLYIQSLYMNDFRVPFGFSIALIDGVQLSGLLENMEWVPQARVLLVNNDNGYIDSDNMDSLPDFTRYQKITIQDNIFYQNMEWGNVAVSHIKSNVTNLEYISLIPTSIYLQQVHHVKSLIYFSIAICLLIGIAASYLLAARNYNPVKKLTQLFIGRLGKPVENYGSEFTFLENSLKSLLDENNSFMTSIRQQKEALKNNLYVKLLKRRIQGTEHIKEALDSYGIRFSGNGFIVILFSLEQLDSRALHENAAEDESTVDMIHFVIRNIVEELADEKYTVYVAEIDGMTAGIVNINDTENQADQIDSDMLRIAQNTLNFMESKFEVHLAASVGCIRIGLDKIGQAYSDALEAMEYIKIVEDPGRIIHYKSIHTDTRYKIDDHFSLEKERQFINCIKAEDFKSASAVLEDIIANDFDKLPLNLVKCRMFGLINSLLNAMGEIRFTLDIEFLDRLDPVNRLLNTKSVAGLKKQIDEIFNHIMEYYSEKEKRDVPSWINGVEDYIATYFSRPELSIAEISEKFNISISYLSRSFKKHRGGNLLDYIHKVRLEHAKRHMKMGMNIKETAEKVGYLEAKALIRSFKRYEGVTPGRFRDSE